MDVFTTLTGFIFYLQLDWRVRPMMMIIKSWAKSRDINDAKEGTLSSYALTLLVINFLQCGLLQPVLPSLHQLFPGVFNLNSNVFTLPFIHSLPTEFKSENQDSLGKKISHTLKHFCLRELFFVFYSLLEIFLFLRSDLGKQLYHDVDFLRLKRALFSFFNALALHKNTQDSVARKKFKAVYI
jgi:hypothetical protein